MDQTQAINLGGLPQDNCQTVSNEQKQESF